MLLPHLSLLTLSIVLSCAPAGAEPAQQLARDRARIMAAIGPETTLAIAVDRIDPTSVAGLYEVVAGADIFYIDASGRYAIVDGRLMDLTTREDLTQKKIDALSSVNFSTLPLHLAIKRVQGNGSRTLAIFEDPTCPACKVVHKFLLQLPDLTVYTFPLPITSPQALPLVRAVWCQADRVKAWEDAMAGRRAPSASACDVAALDQIAELAAQLKVAGTPTMILADGRRIVGALPPAQLVEMIDQLGAPTR
jgi:thiol:disulfide interchange protein DsbC